MCVRVRVCVCVCVCVGGFEEGLTVGEADGKGMGGVGAATAVFW